MGRAYVGDAVENSTNGEFSRVEMFSRYLPIEFGLENPALRPPATAHCAFCPIAHRATNL